MVDTNNGSVRIDSPAFYDLLKNISIDAEERRKAGDTVPPYDALNLARQSGLTAIQLPQQYGGSNANIREVLYVVSKVAQADPDVAHILRAHYLYVGQLLRQNTATESLLKNIQHGTIIGNAFTERSSNNVGHLKFETTLQKEGDHYRLNGTKYFSTGTLYADLVVVTATTEENQPVFVMIPTDRQGVEIQNDWDGIGQKFTASGTTKFSDVFVHIEEVLLVNEKSAPFNSFAQLYLQAVIVGILHNISTDAAELVKNRQRTFTFAAAEKPKDDPQLLQIIGEISSMAFAAQSILLTAAEVLDYAIIHAEDGIIDANLSHEASLRAAQAKVIIDELALKASTLLFEVGGASAVRQSAHLQRHWLNIRTLSSHNPTVYKSRAIGDYTVNDRWLPIQEIYF